MLFSSLNPSVADLVAFLDAIDHAHTCPHIIYALPTNLVTKDGNKLPGFEREQAPALRSFATEVGRPLGKFGSPEHGEGDQVSQLELSDGV
ncbi:MAG TPA: hypothetical protein VGL56_18835 [Fimbriimonadaceae bacterium]